MRIYINDRPCEAQPGDFLLDVAKQNKCHIGYICGGSGVCQSCFVYVKEGMDCLSEPNKVEKAFISDKLTEAGGRLACQTRIMKDGAVRVLSRAEMLRRIVVGLQVPEFITYAQTIGYNVVNQLPTGVGHTFNRVREGQLNPLTSIRNIANGLGPASRLVGRNIFETFPFLQGAVDLAGVGAKGLIDNTSNALCNFSGGSLHLPGASCESCGDEPPVERVHIKASAAKK
ncbi:MAG: (2Fe-2S)-binding protein [Chlorobium sp.]|nr:(2Fe-2S)-binding protein [Chlorobium sp.]